MRKTIALLTVLALGVGLTLAGGAGRTRPGTSGSGSGSGAAPRSGSGSPQRAQGRATYGHGGYYGGGHHGGYYGHGHYGYSHYYYPYSPYAAWPWGWWYGGWPFQALPYKIDPRAPGAVETDVSPKKARILVDGEFVGQPRDYNGRFDLLWLDPGEHLLEFSKDGYRTLRRAVDVQPGMHTRIAEQMEKGEGLDPRSTELSPDPAPDPTAAAASTSIGAAPQGSLRRGLLRLQIGPPDAAVYLDGEFLARASELSRLHGALPVARGPHKLEIVRPGFESRTVEVDVKGEAPLRVEIDLRRAQ